MWEEFVSSCTRKCHAHSLQYQLYSDYTSKINFLLSVHIGVYYIIQLHGVSVLPSILVSPLSLQCNVTLMFVHGWGQKLGMESLCSHIMPYSGKASSDETLQTCGKSGFLERAFVLIYAHHASYCEVQRCDDDLNFNHLHITCRLVRCHGWVLRLTRSSRLQLNEGERIS